MDGSIYLLELTSTLTQMQRNEKALITQMLDRESKREKNLEARGSKPATGSGVAAAGPGLVLRRRV